jgi:putative SOS response-associated peptidase YedK
MVAVGGLYPKQREYTDDGSFTDTDVVEADPATAAEPYHLPLMVPQFLTERVMREQLTMDANEAIRPTNDRMPVLLNSHEYELWLHGSIQDVIGFQFRAPFAAERFRVEQTEDLWRSGKGPPSASPQLALI